MLRHFHRDSYEVFLIRVHSPNLSASIMTSNMIWIELVCELWLMYIQDVPDSLWLWLALHERKDMKSFINQHPQLIWGSFRYSKLLDVTKLLWFIFTQLKFNKAGYSSWSSRWWLLIRLPGYRNQKVNKTDTYKDTVEVLDYEQSIEHLLTNHNVRMGVIVI